MITDKQREQRKLHIGGSDVAAILGVDPFKSAWQIYAEKTDKLESESGGNNAMRIGTILEASAILFAAQKLGKLTRNQYRTFSEWPVLAVNTDAIVKETANPVEAKTTGITYRAPDADQWGEEGTDQVPERVILQATVQCAACEADLCHIPAIIGGRGFVMFQVAFDKGLFELVIEKLQHFWDYNVKQDMPPSDSVPSMDVVKRIIRIPEKTVDVDDSLVERWVQDRDAFLAAEKAKEKSQAEMIAAIGTAEAGKYKDGLITYYSQSKEVFDTARLKAEKPEIASEYMKTTTYRVARIKKTNLLEGRNRGRN